MFFNNVKKDFNMLVLKMLAKIKKIIKLTSGFFFKNINKIKKIKVNTILNFVDNLNLKRILKVLGNSLYICQLKI